MVKKQLNGLGINIWVDEERGVPPNLVTCWCFATDQGGDIVATRRLIQQGMASIPKHIPFEADCWFHVYQLAFGGSLRCADALAQTLCGFDVGYAQTMSVLMNVWREKGSGVVHGMALALPADFTSSTLHAACPVERQVGVLRHMRSIPATSACT